MKPINIMKKLNESEEIITKTYSWNDDYSDEDIAKQEKLCNVKIKKVGEPYKMGGPGELYQDVEVTGKPWDVLCANFEGGKPNELDAKEAGLEKEYKEYIGDKLHEDSGNKKYQYITYANNPEEIGAEYEYNSMANTEVIDMLNDLKTYFTQAEKDAKEIIASAWNDPGVTQKDVDMVKFCAEKVQEIIDKMNSTWE